MSKSSKAEPRPSPPFVLCLAGPTGAGKSAAALYLAEKLGGEIVNADSRQLYADFPIITAQPSPEEQKLCPHHLYGFLPTEAKLSAARWAEMAASKAMAIAAGGRLPLMVGGTGFYLRALLTGMAEIPDIAPEVGTSLAEECRAEGLTAMHARLAGVDPEYAARIHAHDRQRIMRALEVWRATGHSFSWWHARGLGPAPAAGVVLGVGLPLDELTPRLDARIDAMLEAGAMDEARLAMQKSPDPAMPGWSGIGCRELLAFLREEISFDEARLLWLRNTRAYAKRQWTWFKADKTIQWFVPGDFDGLLAAAREALIRNG